MRFLRSYRRVANEEHVCRFCSTPIFPGDEYDAEVWVWESRDLRQGNKIQVRKSHAECPDEDPDDDDRERWFEDKDAYEDEQPQEEDVDDSMIA